MSSETKSKKLIGRRAVRPAWPVNTARVMRRRRWPWSKRAVLRLQGQYNPKTLKREMVLKDKKPLFWVIGLAALLLLPLGVGNQRFLALFGIVCIYAAINVMWTLIIGTAGLQSFATLATVGVGAYGGAYLAITYHVPWPLMLIVGGIFGGLMGFLISLPARRLDGQLSNLIGHGQVRRPQRAGLTAMLAVAAALALALLIVSIVTFTSAANVRSPLAENTVSSPIDNGDMLTTVVGRAKHG